MASLTLLWLLFTLAISSHSVVGYGGSSDSVGGIEEVNSDISTTSEGSKHLHDAIAQHGPFDDQPATTLTNKQRPSNNEIASLT